MDDYGQRMKSKVEYDIFTSCLWRFFFLFFFFGAGASNIEYIICSADIDYCVWEPAHSVHCCFAFNKSLNRY